MDSASNFSDLAHIIQLAVAPVFLLAGIAGFLNVLSGRLGRIVDRARIVERRSDKLKDGAHHQLHEREREILWRRVLMTNWSIGFCTAAALWVCSLIVCLFIAGLWQLAIDTFIAGLFVLAMLMLIVALTLFLFEVQLATRSMRSGGEVLEE